MRVSISYREFYAVAKVQIEKKYTHTQRRCSMHLEKKTMLDGCLKLWEMSNRWRNRPIEVATYAGICVNAIQMGLETSLKGGVWDTMGRCPMEHE